MRILQVHNFYRTSAPSGENKVVFDERTLLQNNGVEVETFYRENDKLEGMGLAGKIAGAAMTPYNPFAAREIKKVIAKTTPDIAHVHNTFPQLSPAIFSAIGGTTGRVLTLHNYRTVCPSALPTRGGEICTECIDKRSSLPALKYNCYRDNKLATLPLALNVSLNRFANTWQNQIDAFIVFSEFQRDMMVRAGFPRDLIHIKPNFFPGNPEVIPFETRPMEAVFIGRLTQEKGVTTLINAWRRWGGTAPDLKIIGDGALRAQLEQEAKGLNITFLGQLPHEKTVQELAQARLVVLPSECYEGFPMVLQEAFASATPIAISDIGPLPSLIGNPPAGNKFEPKNPDALLAAITHLWSDQEDLAKKSHLAQQLFEKFYTDKANLQLLLSIYQSAIDEKKQRLTKRK